MIPLNFRGQRYNLTVEEAEALLDQIQKPVGAARMAREEAHEAAMRAAGQVWIANFSRFHSFGQEKFYSLRDALDFLENSADHGELVPISVSLPGGGFLDGPELAQRLAAFQ